MKPRANPKNRAASAASSTFQQKTSSKEVKTNEPRLHVDTTPFPIRVSKVSSLAGALTKMCEISQTLKALSRVTVMKLSQGGKIADVRNDSTKLQEKIRMTIVDTEMTTEEKSLCTKTFGGSSKVSSIQFSKSTSTVHIDNRPNRKRYKLGKS